MSNNSNKIDYTIEVITEDEKEEVYKFLLEYFVKDEPIHKCLGLIDIPEIKEFFLKSLSQRCSFKAVTENGEIMGICISAIRKRTDEPNTNKSVNEKWKIIGNFLVEVENGYKILDHYPIFLDGKAIATHPKFRGMGIAGELLKKSTEFIKENNIPAMRRICSSAYSARVMEKLGMKEVNRILFEDFKDENGEQILKTEKPHTMCRSFVVEA